ncbi:unnamed protein product [Leuciscus chuanchicus]
MGSDEEFTPTATSTSQQAGRRGSRGVRGASGRARGRRGGGRRVGPTPEHLSREDMARVENLRLERTAYYEREQIQQLNLQQTQQVLKQCLARDPSLIFEVLSHLGPAAPPTLPPVPGQLSWCICQRCREMPTVVERKCCLQQPPLCISTLPHMEAYILQAGVLRLAQRIWNDLRAGVNLPDEGVDNKQFRHAAYRQFVAWQCGTLGPGHRVVIPSCCVWAIRDHSPDPHGQYRGFILKREGEDIFELHAVQSELEAVEKQIHDLLVRQADLIYRWLALETSRADAHKSEINVTNPLTPTSSTPCVTQHWSRAPRSRSAMVSFTPAPTRRHEAWIFPQRKTRVSHHCMNEDTE